MFLKSTRQSCFCTCADPGIFFRGGGGGGGPGQSLKKAQTTFFFFLFFLYSSAYFTEVKWLISKKTIIFQGSRGGPTFSRGGGGPTFSRGSNCLFPIETHITCDFPGGGGPDPCPPPLDPHLLHAIIVLKNQLFEAFSSMFSSNKITNAIIASKHVFLSHKYLLYSYNQQARLHCFILIRADSSRGLRVSYVHLQYNF